MQIDPEYLRRQYNSLSDEALLAVQRADLVALAQKCYDDELERRNLTSKTKNSRSGRRHGLPAKDPTKPFESGDQPDWLSEASEVYSRDDRAGAYPAPEVENAREVLEAAGIPCQLDVVEIPDDKTDFPPLYQWRIRVPGSLNLLASSILERDVFNEQFEADWKTHLEELSDDELRSMTPQTVFRGLFDRIERVTKAYDEEIARRGL